MNLGNLVGRGIGPFIDQVLNRGTGDGAVGLRRQRQRNVLPRSSRLLLRRGQSG